LNWFRNNKTRILYCYLDLTSFKYLTDLQSLLSNVLNDNFNLIFLFCWIGNRLKSILLFNSLDELKSNKSIDSFMDLWPVRVISQVYWFISEYLLTFIENDPKGFSRFINSCDSALLNNVKKKIVKKILYFIMTYNTVFLNFFKKNPWWSRLRLKLFLYISSKEKNWLRDVKILI